MRQKVLSLLKVYEDEVSLLLWTTALLFLVRSSGMILNNFAETAFLKRYGVEFLPIVTMINSILTFVVTGFLTVFMSKVTGIRLLSSLFLFSGISVVIVRILIPLGFEIIYPILFMLKNQFELLQALLFWNLASDFFNTRQSKRLFTLLSAGGVLGLIISSFGTRFFDRAFSLDNLLYLYTATTFMGAVLVEMMGRQFSALVFSGEKKETGKKKASMAEEFKTILPLLKKSTLLKIVLILNFMPNVILTIMNYQFYYAINDYFASETDMLRFFAYFRGWLNIINLLILLFVGRIYGRWGLPVALMFHPFNYIIALFGFLLNFGMFSAMYARISTNIIKTTIWLPSKEILIGLFPLSYKRMIRPFLKGTVVRAAILLSSGLILFSQNHIHPRYLTLVALPFLITWIAASVLLKHKYAKILKDLVANNLLDLKRLDPEELIQVFKEGTALDELKKSFLSAKGDDAVWYARLLNNFSIDDFDAIILTNINNQDDLTKIALVKMLSPEFFRTSRDQILNLLDPKKTELTIAILKLAVLHRFEDVKKIDLKLFENNENPVVRGFAIGCMYFNNSVEYEKIINKMVLSKNMELRKSGIISAGLTGKIDYIPVLENILYQDGLEPLIPDTIIALSRLKADNLNHMVMQFLSNEIEEIRFTALDAFEIKDEPTLLKAVLLLGDRSKTIRELGKQKIRESIYENNKLLIQSLAFPSTHIRQELFELLEMLDIKDLDVFIFVKEHLKTCYNYIAMSHHLENLPESRFRNQVMEHLVQKKELELENIIRVLAIHDQTGRMRTAWRGIFSPDTRQRANAIELLSDILDKKLFNTMLPLLESPNLTVALAEGKKVTKIPRFDRYGKEVFITLISSEDWVDVLMGLSLAQDHPSLLEGHELLEKLEASNNRIIIEEVKMTLRKKNKDSKNAIKHGTELFFADKLLLLKEIEIFSGLNVIELATIASVTKEFDYPAEKTVIKQNDIGETVFLIIDGEVDVIMELPDEKQVIIDKIDPGGAFGEMALIDNSLRSATIRTTKKSRFLILHKREFKETVMAYPRIALQICSVLSRRIRHLHKRVKETQ